VDKIGIFYALGAYTAWGVFPIYWKLLKHLPSHEIILHRIIWAFFFYAGWLMWRSYRERTMATSWAELRGQLSFKNIRLFVISCALITLNWYLYVYAVNSNHILQSSLGYYINPIFSGVLGVFVLNEKITGLKRWAAGLCMTAVFLFTYAYGQFPWIALTLAGSFSLYGLVRKKSRVDVLTHSTLELLIVLPLALVALVYVRSHSSVELTVRDWALLILSGAVTGLPLIWFAESAQRIPLFALGFFQYIAPTLQFMCGLFLYSEPISSFQLWAFALIWLGVALFICDTILGLRNEKRELED